MNLNQRNVGRGLGHWAPLALVTVMALAPQFALAQTGTTSETAPPSEAAKPASSGAPPVSFAISVVYATENPGKVDPAGLELVSRLPMKIGSVEVLDTMNVNVDFGENAALPLSSGGEIHLLPVLVHQNKLHMQFEMPHVVNTRLKMTHNRPVILGGVPYRDGYLIIQVMPNFSKYLVTPPVLDPNRPLLPKTFKVTLPKRKRRE